MLAANNQKIRRWNRWILSNLLDWCQSTRGILADINIWIFGHCMGNIPTSLEGLTEANLLSKHVENHWNLTVGRSLCFLHEWKQDTHPLLKFQCFRRFHSTTVHFCKTTEWSRFFAFSVYTGFPVPVWKVCLLFAVWFFSENSDPGWSKHWKEHLMASVAGQEVCGGVPAHAGDPSHQYPLELQK